MLTCAVTLLNSNAYGSQSLIALFFFCILSTFAASFIFIILLLKNKTIAFFLPAHIILFIIFTLYVLLHGLLTNSIGLTHFYWFSSSIFIVAFYYWSVILTIKYKIQRQQVQSYFYRGISILALIESMIVILQFVKLFPVPNPLFLCTGSWANPNVTAMFLALSLFAIISSYKEMTLSEKRKFYASIFITVLFAIAFLLCRSAYIVTAVIILSAFKPVMLTPLQKKFKLSGWLYKGSIIILVLIPLSLITGTFKKVSAINRISIWQESFELFKKNPLFGNGFGMFEKEYNLFAAERQNPVNEHINMPYNDFLELSIDGGIVAVILWVLFLLQICYYCFRKKQRKLLLLLLSFCIIQFTNFGFQAIPVFILFLIYVALETEVALSGWGIFNITNKNSFFRISAVSILFGTAVYLFFTVVNLSTAFYKKWDISKKTPSYNLIAKYQLLNRQLYKYSSYQENLGNMYLEVKDFRYALAHFLLALKRSSKPELFAKSGYCYQLLNIYDSSEYYYKIASFMEPHKFIPHNALLKLYQQKKDTILLRAEATKILSMPVKVDGRRVMQIRQFADSVLKSLNIIQK
jgi:O-antigen polymerase